MPPATRRPTAPPPPPRNGNNNSNSAAFQSDRSTPTPSKSGFKLGPKSIAAHVAQKVLSPQPQPPPPSTSTHHYTIILFSITKTTTNHAANPSPVTYKTRFYPKYPSPASTATPYHSSTNSTHSLAHPNASAPAIPPDPSESAFPAHATNPRTNPMHKSAPVEQ